MILHSCFRFLEEEVPCFEVRERDRVGLGPLWDGGSNIVGSSEFSISVDGTVIQFGGLFSGLGGNKGGDFLWY